MTRTGDAVAAAGGHTGAVFRARVDVALAVGLAVVSAVLTAVVPAEPPFRAPGVLGVALAAVSALALVARRTAPETVVAVTSALLVVYVLAGFDVGVVQWPPWIALYTCFAAGGRRPRLVGAIACVAAVSGYAVFTRGPGDASALADVAIIGLLAAVAGEATRNRRVAVAASRSRELAEGRERALALDRMRLDERTRLAGELHDALGHAVNVIVLQAGVARRVFAERPEFARDALGTIETTGREALGELDQVLRVLHPDDAAETEPLGPRGIDGVDELAERVRAVGREVTVEIEPVELGPGAGRALYRIVQEALTNAVRHTESGRIRVSVTPDGEHVRVLVFNEATGLARPQPGRGLVGMRERARLAGGTLEAGPVDGGFQVLATLRAA
ncbi:sensor histidine kinase [Cryptosporangium arvum]|uniref:histidine kinase n=1 Tax=Cryptosporangium arvum DSM 44712 TaxID=927661 RepID=A0A011AIC5_9ACTN|nr:histidine kinase [Cryptosporangium arvum]EXG81736.1 Histidine kinase,'ATPase, histidine kinase/DNA gyrase B/HSP90-like' [Cryptosporangium arvum DSM 44712]